jgi:ssDNA-binding Zn-finger/Zn-ribbon topoisomerase 1
MNYVVDVKMRCVCGKISHVKYYMNAEGVFESSESTYCACGEFILSIKQKEGKFKAKTIYPNCEFVEHSSKANLKNLKLAKPAVLEQTVSVNRLPLDSLKEV